MQTIQSVDEYIDSFEEPIRSKLVEMRAILKHLAPDAEEKIAYGMPGYLYKGVRFYFAGFKKHIGLYPGAACIHQYSNLLTNFKTGKGSIQFPINSQLPTDLIRLIIGERIQNNQK